MLIFPILQHGRLIRAERSEEYVFVPFFFIFCSAFYFSLGLNSAKKRGVRGEFFEVKICGDFFD